MDVLKKLGPAVREPAREMRTESVTTLKFAFHPWDRIDNRKTHGVRFGMPGEYAVLPRMALIYLPTLEVPKLRPKNSGFAVGKVTAFGVSAAAAVGSDVEIRPQYPSQTAEKLKKAYGDKGLVILESLTAEADADKEESILVYAGVMNTSPGGEVRGAEVIMEDFPDWLDRVAPERLDAALKEGVVYDGEVYPLKPSARRKGLALIAELKQSIKVSNQTALGVLKKTKKELTAANKGINDSKAIPDPLDEFLLYHHPSFSLDTEVERATRAAEGAVRASREGAGGGGVDGALIGRVLEQNERLIEQNARLAERVVALEEGARQSHPAPQQ